ncbi:hypothetical protein pdam_00025654 [Pocillopora damicornis]|uniref:Uncharacterized protein n=1 Tax=Pocillopora damicornis TaxID=46731 RepID=A0A3M6UEW1_POCDA|nr:hypothetical protein pdam_00025654 [Pocillopora damicornis]
MKLLPKVHKLDKPASPDNISKLTGPPIITAHNRNILFPLTYNSMYLLILLDALYITDMDALCFTMFDFTSRTLPSMTPYTPSTRAKIYLTCPFSLGITYLTLIILLISAIFSLLVITRISRSTVSTFTILLSRRIVHVTNVIEK